MMQLNQCLDRDSRGSEPHPGADGGVEHPRRHHNNLAGRHFHVNDIAAGAPLSVMASEPPSVERVPSVMNLDLLPDMGRMTL